MTVSIVGNQERAAQVERGFVGLAQQSGRRTKAAIAAIKDDIKDILRNDHPMTVRQVFYQLVVRGTIEKTEAQYRSALRECSVYLEIWSEKEALAGIIWDVASEYDVPVLISKGMPSLTQLYGTAVEIQRAAQAGKCAYIYQFGDHDPSGVLIPRTIGRRLEQLCERLDCLGPTIERVALTVEQIAEFNLPTRPTKREANRHANSFEGDSVELDALPSGALRDLVRKTIEQHIRPAALDALRAAEESERELIEEWAANMGSASQ